MGLDATYVEREIAGSEAKIDGSNTRKAISLMSQNEKWSATRR